MQFVYYYKTSDGVRHEAEMSAPSRDEVFAALKQQGIRPIKVVSKHGSRANGEVRIVGKRLIFAALTLGLVIGGTVMFFGNDKESNFYKADGTIGVERKGNVCVPMLRRQIFGNREKIDNLLADGAQLIFSNAGETFLARFAEPGRNAAKMPEMTSALEKALQESLNEPIYTFDGELHECVELKRIVAGMKEEMRMFLAAGGTIREYATRLAGRQELEASHLASAQEKMAKSLQTDTPQESLAAWRGLNSWLNAMGIAQLPLPMALEEVYDSEEYSEGVSSPPIRLP